MSRLPACLRVPLTLLVFALALFGLAGGVALSLEAAGAELLPSPLPALLGPIQESGRTGWDCAPEKAARASTWLRAELPADR